MLADVKFLKMILLAEFTDWEVTGLLVCACIYALGVLIGTIAKYYNKDERRD